jgi:hypothetical protein
MNETFAAIAKLVSTFDANQRAILENEVLRAFDEHVTVPGPDGFVKGKLRPKLQESLENWLTNTKVNQ